jgi:hypothetical protein
MNEFILTKLQLLVCNIWFLSTLIMTFLLNFSINNLQEVATERCLRVVNNFLMKFIEKEIILT